MEYDIDLSEQQTANYLNQDDQKLIDDMMKVIESIDQLKIEDNEIVYE